MQSSHIWVDTTQGNVMTYKIHSDYWSCLIIEKGQMERKRVPKGVIIKPAKKFGILEGTI